MTLKPRTKVTARCAAKLNLTFEIIGDLPGGYHEVRTLLQTIDLEDDVSLTLQPGDSGKPEASGIIFSDYKSEVPGDFPLTESNLIAKAIRKFQDAIPTSRAYTVHVEVEKRIPIGAGLAGGSANAAAALVAMNEHFQNPLTQQQLLEIGATIGADVPFSICGGTMVGRHRGDRLDAVESSSKLFFTIVKPRHLSVSTVWAYKQFDVLAANTENQEGKPTRCQSETFSAHCATAIGAGDLKVLSETLYNDLEKVVFQEHPQLKAIRDRLVELGAWACRMTGSGPTLYALVADREQSHQLRRKLKEQRDINIDELDIWLTESIDHGARIVPASG